MATTIKPFNYASDGTFLRASAAWAVVPDTGEGAVVDAYATDERRVFIVGVAPPEAWILCEGARQNIVSQPTNWATAPWAVATNDAGTGNPLDPFGDANLIAAGDVATYPFYTPGSGPTVTHALSAFARFAPGEGNTVSVLVSDTDTDDQLTTDDDDLWHRFSTTFTPDGATANVLSISNFDGINPMRGWGLCAELNPGSTAAFFASSPILTGGATRAIDHYVPGQFTADQIAATGGVRVRFRPEFPSFRVASGNEFAIWSVPSGGNRIGVSITSVADGTARISAGLSTALVHQTVTFDADQEITVQVFQTGLVRIDGATTGNGTFGTGTNAFTLPAATNVSVGCVVAAGTPTLGAFSLIAPLELVTQVVLTGGEQLTLNSVRLDFDNAPLAFDVNGINDALNLDYYTVSGSPGLPRIQHVAALAPSSLAVYFDQPIAADALVRIALTGFVTAPSTFQVIAFGAEQAAVADRQVLLPRVDIANPQTPRDAGTLTPGTLVVTETGDLGNDFGRANLRKRINRVLSTVRGGFFHLPGYGLLPESKALITPTSLRRLQLDVESQVRALAGVVTARAAVREIAPGVVNVRLRVEDDNGAFEHEGQLDFTE